MGEGGKQSTSEDFKQSKVQFHMRQGPHDSRSHSFFFKGALKGQSRLKPPISLARVFTTPPLSLL